MHSLKQLAVVVILTVCIVAAACVDMNAPKGPASISLLQLPSLYIVQGDTMRDTNGVAMSPSVIAYDAAGNVLSDQSAQFFITDSLPVAHFGNGKLVGDAVGTVHVVGQIGNVQTPATPIPVTLAPDTMVATLTSDTITVPVGPDSASSIGILGLGVVVHATDGQTPVPGVIVNYTLAPVASSSSSSPSVYLTGDGNTISAVDTTDGGGNASRTLNVNSRLLTGESGGTVSTIVNVTASAKYKGKVLKGGPLVFSIPIKLTFSLR